MGALGAVELFGLGLETLLGKGPLRRADSTVLTFDLHWSTVAWVWGYGTLAGLRRPVAMVPWTQLRRGIAPRETAMTGLGGVSTY